MQRLVGHNQRAYGTGMLQQLSYPLGLSCSSYAIALPVQ